MKARRRTLLTLAVLHCAGCAVAPTGGDEQSGDKVAQTEEGLYETYSSCKTGSALRTITLNGSSAWDNIASEGTITSRPSTCNAWVVDYKWSTAPTRPNSYLMAGTSNSMPGDHDNCLGVWRSDQWWGFTSSTSYNLHEGDHYAEWDGSQCLWPGSMDSPQDGGVQNILHLDNGSSQAINRLKTYNRVRFITQPHWIYWPIPGWTDLYITN